jgi:deoxycytidylate deaminase
MTEKSTDPISRSTDTQGPSRTPDDADQQDMGLATTRRTKGRSIRVESRPKILTQESPPSTTPLTETPKTSTNDRTHRTEIVVAFVAPTGVDSETVLAAIEAELAGLHYRTERIHLSKYLEGRCELEAGVPGDERIRKLQDAGDILRKEHGEGALSTVAVSTIRHRRHEYWLTEVGEDRENVPAPATAYLVWSLKHPGEADVLRRVYRSRFLLVSVYQSKDHRQRALAERFAADRNRSGHEDDYLAEALSTIHRDEGEAQPKHAQDVSDVYPTADLFLDATDARVLAETIQRAIQVVFGNPFMTPTRDEYGMNIAYAAALRSAEMGRQVGACITTAQGDVIVTGTNDVPKAGGGQYWTGDPRDARDYVTGRDTNDLHKRQLAEQLVELVALSQNDGDKRKRERLVLDALERTKLKDVIEYSRAIHAEMSAITDAARRGVSISGSTLYTTTFPCHLCTGLIVASGIARVVYMYPYPKSLAVALHRDAIAVETQGRSEGVVPFEPFLGVAPRSYVSAFTMPIRKDKGGKGIQWTPNKARFRLVEDELARTGDVPDYIDRELLTESEANWLVPPVSGEESTDG